MTKIVRYAIAYVMWIIDLGLAMWLIFISRTVFLDILALSYGTGSWVYSRRVDLADKFFLLILGLGWLIFMVIVEAHFRAGAQSADLFRRFARVTGPVLLSIFGVDLILFWLQGVNAGNWFRWLILAAELGIGIALFKMGRAHLRPEST